MDIARRVASSAASVLQSSTVRVLRGLSPIRCAVPLVTVVAANLVALCGGSARGAWYNLLDLETPWTWAVLAVTAVAAVAQGVASARPIRGWFALLPMAPHLVATSGAWCAPAQLIRDPESVVAALRLWGSLEALALCLSAMVALAPALRLRADTGRARWGHPAVWAASVAVLSFVAPVMRRHGELWSPTWFALAVAGLAPAIALRLLPPRDPPPGASPEPSPYRTAAGDSPGSVDGIPPASALWVAAWTIPWIARVQLRAVAHLLHWWNAGNVFAWKFSFEDPAGGDGLLEVTRRWELYLLPLAVAFVAWTGLRRVDRRALRAWAAAVVTLLALDRAVAARVIVLRASESEVARGVFVLGVRWRDEGPTLDAPAPAERWTSDGAVMPVRPSLLRAEVLWGPTVYLDPRMRGDVWQAHLRRWRAGSSAGSLTFAGLCPHRPVAWWDDPRQEFARVERASPTWCFVRAEVAAASAARRAVTTARVLDADHLRVDGAARPIRPTQVSREVDAIRVVPDSADVTVESILAAAMQLQGSRARVYVDGAP